MVAPFHAQRAAESDASVRLRVRSHVPGRRRDRAQAEEAGIQKAKPGIGLVPQESAYGPSSQEVRPMNRLRRTSQVHATLPAPRPEGPRCGRSCASGLGCGTGGAHVRRVYVPEPPWCACLRVWRHPPSTTPQNGTEAFCDVAVVPIFSWILAAPGDIVSSVAGYQFCH
jgi:hypothetical protein